MKAFLKLCVGLLLFSGVLFLGSVNQPQPKSLQARQLQGESARQFLADASILEKIAGDSLTTHGQRRTFTEMGSFKASDAVVFDRFGFSVAVHGNTAVVGAPHARTGHSIGSGAAYVFEYDGERWSQQQKLIAGDDEAEDFGHAVALGGDTVIISAPRNFYGSSGQAYVFVHDGGEWRQQQKLVASDAASDFGLSIALDGDTAVIGATIVPHYPEDQSAVFIFTRSGTTWSEQQKFFSRDEYWYIAGVAVAVDGDTVVLGVNVYEGYLAKYTATIYTRSGTQWSEQQKLADWDGWDNYTEISVALDGDTAVVGVPEVEARRIGAVYVYKNNGKQWSEQQELTADDRQDFDFFGGSVALDGDTLIIGAPGAGVTDDDDLGSAYVFIRSDETWWQDQKLSAADGTAHGFGRCVALNGDMAFFGAPKRFYSLDEYQGRAYFFERKELENHQFLPVVNRS